MNPPAMGTVSLQVVRSPSVKDSVTLPLSRVQSATPEAGMPGARGPGRRPRAARSSRPETRLAGPEATQGARPAEAGGAPGSGPDPPQGASGDPEGWPAP